MSCCTSVLYRSIRRQPEHGRDVLGPQRLDRVGEDLLDVAVRTSGSTAASMPGCHGGTVTTPIGDPLAVAPRFLFSSDPRARFRSPASPVPARISVIVSRVISSRDSRLSSPANRSVSSVICWRRLPIRSLTAVSR